MYICKENVYSSSERETDDELGAFEEFHALQTRMQKKTCCILKMIRSP